LEPANATTSDLVLEALEPLTIATPCEVHLQPQEELIRVPLTDFVPENLVTLSTIVCEDPPQEQHNFPAIPLVSIDLATEEIVSPSNVSSECPEDITTGATFASNPNEIADNPPAMSPQEDKVAQEEDQETTEAIGVPDMTEPIALQMQQNNLGDSCTDVELNVLAQAVLVEEAMQHTMQEATDTLTVVAEHSELSDIATISQDMQSLPEAPLLLSGFYHKHVTAELECNSWVDTILDISTNGVESNNSEDLPLGEPDIQGSVDTNEVDALAEEKTGQIILGLTRGDTVEQAEEHFNYAAEEQQQLGTEILPPKDVCALPMACQLDETSKTPASATLEGSAQDLSEQMESSAIIGISEVQVSIDCKLLN
jgi:hypothetical protein